MSKPNSFDVLKAMSARNWNIQLAPLDNIRGAQKTNAGTLVTIGVGGDLVAAIADGRFVGGLILADKIQYAAMEKTLAEADDPMPALVAALRSVEWACTASTCPACGGHMRHGHREGCGCGHKDACVVATAIAKAEGR